MEFSQVSWLNHCSRELVLFVYLDTGRWMDVSHFAFSFSSLWLES